MVVAISQNDLLKAAVVKPDVGAVREYLSRGALPSRALPSDGGSISLFMRAPDELHRRREFCANALAAAAGSTTRSAARAHVA